MPPSAPQRVVGVARFGTSEAERASVVVRRGSRGAGTVMVFSSLQAKRAIPTPEFVGTLAGYDVTVLFVKDLEHSYYQRGLAQVADSPEAAAEALHDLIPRRSTLIGTVGTSMGGYGAILYGCLLAAPQVVAFSPRTHITALMNRRLALILPAHRELDVDGPHADLRRTLATGAPRAVDVHVSDTDPMDVEQVARIADLDGVRVHRYPVPDHYCARWLRERGRLAEALEAALPLPARGDPRPRLRRLWAKR